MFRHRKLLGDISDSNQNGHSANVEIKRRESLLFLFSIILWCVPVSDIHVCIYVHFCVCMVHLHLSACVYVHIYVKVQDGCWVSPSVGLTPYSRRQALAIKPRPPYRLVLLSSLLWDPMSTSWGSTVGPPTLRWVLGIQTLVFMFVWQVL